MTRLLCRIKAEAYREMMRRLENELGWIEDRADYLSIQEEDLQEFTFHRVMSMEQVDGKLLIRFDCGTILLTYGGIHIEFPDGRMLSSNLGV